MNQKQIIQTELQQLWKQKLLVFILSVVLLSLVFFNTIDSMVQIWLRSETFTHGFLILPISLYLVWMNKKQLSFIAPATEVWALPLIAVVAFGWLMASLVGVQVVQQWAFVTLLILFVLLIFGWPVVKQLLFPLLYLYFMVPFGEQFIDPMMHMTARFVISAIELTGIPIYSEGTFFTLPSGSWSVVEGCSGVRYLIASIALGTLYAYMTYSSYIKRGVFILASIIFPIVANWLRAFMIVMLGHFSNMKLATGVDHIIYGWVFFGIVIFIMFWVGSYWRDEEAKFKIPENVTLSKEKRSTVIISLVSAYLLIAVTAFMEHQIEQRSTQDLSKVSEIKLFDNPHWKKQPQRAIKWTPQYINPTLQYQQEYRAENPQQDDIIGLYIAFYAIQKQDSELINSQNIMIRQKHPVWAQKSENAQTISLQNQAQSILETHLSSNNEDLLIWHWNVINDQVLTNSYKAKLIEAIKQLSGDTRGEYAIVIYTHLDKADMNASRQRLQQFINDMLPTIQQSVQQK